MYYLDKLCCICLHHKSSMNLIFGLDNEGIRHYDKVTCVAKSFFIEMKHQKHICAECTKNLETAYNFQQQCMKSKTIFSEYLSQLRQYSNTSGKVSVKLKDFQRHLKIENFKTRTECYRQKFEQNFCSVELEIKNEYSLNHTEIIENRRIESGLKNGLQTTNYYHNVALNEECNIGNEANKTHIKTEQKNTDIYEENNTVIQTICKEEIDIEEHLTPDGINILYNKTTNCAKNDGENESIRQNVCFSSISVKSIRNVGLEDNANQTRCIELYNNLKEANSVIDGSTNQANNLNTPYSIKQLDDSKSKTDMHTKNGPLLKIYACEYCNKVFPAPYRLRAHLQVHTGEKVLTIPVCTICDQKFQNPNQLKMHRRQHKKVFICNVCKEQFNNIEALREHKLKHVGERNYECSVCHKKFLQKGHLAFHSKAHLGAIHECEICHKKYSYVHNLKQHMLTHSAVKPFQCNVCYKRFNHKSNMNTHMNVHKADRRYQCHICLRKFTFKPNLKIHMLLHSGEKPYKCEICGYRVNRKDTLKKHMMIHEKNAKFGTI